jgi:WhiB family transcriptional regulator, redox-sensing transcriptional regulator
VTARHPAGTGRLHKLVLPAGVATGWQYDAACQDAPDPDAFFPGKGEDDEAAKQVCAGCPVTSQCLEFALQTMPHPSMDFGVYGGLTPTERARLRGGPLLVRGHRLDSRAQAVIGRKLASRVGVAAAARALGVTPQALTDAWQRRGLAWLPTRHAPREAGERLYRDRVVAEQALELARTVGVTRAAARLGVSHGVLYRAWHRHGLDRPAMPRQRAADRTGATGRAGRGRDGRSRRGEVGDRERR